MTELQAPREPQWEIHCFVTTDQWNPLLDYFEEFALAVSCFEEGVGFRIIALCDQKPDLNQLEKDLKALEKRYGISYEDLNIVSHISQDWLAENRKDFPLLTIGNYLIYRSHHERPVSPDKILIKLDATSAFGSGTHESTQGCLTALSEISAKFQPQSFLDLGCGSGILAIAMAKTWNHPVTATDYDAEAIRVTMENARLNQVESLIEGHCATGLDHPQLNLQTFDLIMANILAGPLCEMAPILSNTLSLGGHLILSGLLVSQIPQLYATYHTLHLVKEYRLGEWASLVLTQ